MSFHDVAPSRTELFDRFATALESDRSAIYIDSSVLIHCYEMSAGAAGEFLDGLERFDGRVHVPLWVAQETFKHSLDHNETTPLKKGASEITKKIERYIQEAMRMADATVGSGQTALARDEFEGQIETAFAGLRNLINLVADQRQTPQAMADRLRAFLRKYTISSDLAAIYTKANDEGAFRFAHGIPPGHADSRKQGPEGAPQAGRNPLGDLIVWFEILEHAKANGREAIILLTRDVTKGDWVYDVERVRNEQGRLQQNRTIKLPWPLLDHEARAYCPALQADGLHIHSLNGFVQIASERLGMNLPKLAAALQVGLDASASVDPPPATTEQSSELPANGGVTSEPTILSEPISFTSSDLSYEPDGLSPLDDIGLQLRTNDWDLHARAIQGLTPALIAEASKREHIFLGTALAHAANALSISALRRLEKLLAPANNPFAAHFLLGALAQVFLDDGANLKKPKASLPLARLLYDAASEQPAVAKALLDRMQSQRAQYLALPSDPARRIELTLRAHPTNDGAQLQGAEADGIALLEPGAAESRALSPLSRIVSGEELVDLIATEFVVPAAWFQTSLVRGTKYLVPARLGFIDWGPGTGCQLRKVQ